MNPYESSKETESVAEDGKIDSNQRERIRVRCKQCGGTNTAGDDALRIRPSIAMVIFFGWVFLLIRGAFAMREMQCLDCGAVHRYKTTGSKMALVCLVVIVLLLAISMMEGG